MRNPTALENLSAKIALLVERYNRVRDEKIMLSKELAESKKMIEKQREEIIRLQKNEELRIMKIEEITKKIMEVALVDDDIPIKNEYEKFETKKDYLIPNPQITATTQIISSVDEVRSNPYKDIFDFHQHQKSYF
jgi:hypothetical protein